MYHFSSQWGYKLKIAYFEDSPEWRWIPRSEDKDLAHTCFRFSLVCIRQFP